MKKMICCVMSALFLLASIGCKPEENDPNRGNYVEPAADTFEVSQESTVLGLSSTDAMGRYFGAQESFNENKVGLFYFLWIGQHDKNGDDLPGAAWDLSRMSEADIKGMEQEAGVFHYWSEPLYDYYNSEDPWVFRKHLELFVMAGIDYLVFDVSNSYYYKTVCDNIFPVALEYVEAGWEIPKFIFYCHNKTRDTVTGLYNDFYHPDDPALRKYDALWYREEDNGVRNREQKPWILVKNNGTGTGDQGANQNFDACSAEIRDFFYTRELRWGLEQAGEGSEWLFPSDIDNPTAHEGMLSVSVAQHNSGAFSDSVLEENRRDSNRGRGWVREENTTGDRSRGTNVASNVYAGTNYAEEWEYAFSLGDQVNNIFLSTWNEWVAQKQPKGLYGRSTCYFVDQFNPEFSRDLEMTKGLWGDNFYLQTASMVRQFKSTGASGGFVPRQAKIDLAGDPVSQWENTVGYLDFTGDTARRNYRSANTRSYGNVPVTTYTNDSGRNDIKQVNVTCDDRYLYFRVECAEDITAYEPGDRTWMNILIEVEGLSGPNWENYQYVVNRTVYENGGKMVSYLERLSADGKSTKEEAVDISVSGEYLTVRIPRKSLSIDREHFSVAFKVADHVTKDTDIMDYYVNGDAAPIGRLNYTFSV